MNSVNSKLKHDNKTGFIVMVIILVIVAVGGAVVALFMGEKMKAEEREKRASEVSVKNESEISKKKYGSSKVKNEVKQEEEEPLKSKNIENETGARYIEPKGWDVRFKIPENVIDVKYEMQDQNYDGQINILGIATKDKVYDVNICGGKEAYKHYPFFLGQVSRWDPKTKHEDWQSSPISAGSVLSLKVNGVEYFVNSHYGNGCENGREQNPAYIEAIELSKKLIEGMEKK